MFKFSFQVFYFFSKQGCGVVHWWCCIVAEFNLTIYNISDFFV